MPRGERLQIYKNNNVEIHYDTLGQKDAPVILWAHGWGQSHKGFMPFAQSFESSAKHVLVDFPGFGNSPAPHDIGSTAEYADAMAGFIKEQCGGEVIWVGHSFGCRVGLQMAAREPIISACGTRHKKQSPTPQA